MTPSVTTPLPKEELKSTPTTDTSKITEVTSHARKWKKGLIASAIIKIAAIVLAVLMAALTLTFFFPAALPVITFKAAVIATAFTVLFVTTSFAASVAETILLKKKKNEDAKILSQKEIEDGKVLNQKNVEIQNLSLTVMTLRNKIANKDEQIKKACKEIRIEDMQELLGKMQNFQKQEPKDQPETLTDQEKHERNVSNIMKNIPKMKGFPEDESITGQDLVDFEISSSLQMLEEYEEEESVEIEEIEDDIDIPESFIETEKI